MVYSHKKAMSLRPRKELGLSTFFIALATAAAIFLPFIIMKDGYFIFYGDFNVQQIPFYQMCHQMVREGNFTGWNQYTDLGVNFIGSYSFYLLGSPFFWLTIPFPNAVVPYLMGPLLILKFAFAAWTAYLFIRRFTRLPETARLGGILYAFCGFSVYNIFFNHFHEAIIVFPLLLLSLELLLTENRRGVFALAVCLSAVTNYFFFYGMVIFTVIYFIIRLTSRAVTITLGRFLTVALEAVIGLLLSAFILLPTILCVGSMSRTGEFLIGWPAIMYGKEQIYLNIIECFFFPPDIPARPVFFPGADVKWSSLGGWLPMFGMTGVLAYCMAKRGSWIKRIICTSFVFSFFPILNSSFSFFNSAYYARWFFMPILIMALATVMALEDTDISWNSAFRWVGGITAAFALVIGLFPQRIKADDGSDKVKYIFGLFTEPLNRTYLLRFWVACAIAVAGLLMTLAVVKGMKKRDRGFFNIALCFVCMISIIYGAVFIYEGSGLSNSKEVVIDNIIEGEVTLEGDKDTFRVDTYDCEDNTPMFYGYSSVNAFHSIVPQSIVDFYEFIGEERDVASRPESDNYALRNLLSVKYVFNLINEKPFEENGETKMPGYTFYDTKAGHLIYENDNYIPMGFTYDNYVSYETIEDFGSNYRANIMLKGILLSDEQIKKYGDILSPLPSEGYYLFDEAELSADCKALADTASDDFTYTDNGFTATINTEKDTLAFFSVPFEAGWKATVNGKAVDIEKVNVGFMAVPVEAGENDIVFTYKTPGLYEGVIISGGSAAVFIIYLIICAATKKRRAKEEPYPEGDALIDKWLADDIAENEDTEAQNEELSLESIADSLGREYPVNPEFSGGFTVTLDKKETLE